MTIPRAAGLVIEAAFLADGLSTFVLEMGQPRVIAGLVTRYAAGRGYPVPAIRFTGRRAGEKPGEELVADGETPRPALHPAITAVDAVTVPPDGIVALCGAASGVLTLTGGVLYPYPSVFGYHEAFHVYVCVAAGCQYAAIAWFAR
jgi:Polysaccharide biosynthesis protein